MITSYRVFGFDWELAGRDLGETLGAYNAIVVVGMDADITGRVAVGIARGQSFKRRVAVADLFAESPPIQALVQTDDPHGLVDSFLYGVSLSRIAYEVPGSGQLFVMPSGSEAPNYEEMLPSPRWHRLVAGFREVGALLVLAAPADAAHIETLVAVTDGAVVVGDAAPRLLPVSRVIASVREPALGLPASAPHAPDIARKTTPVLAPPPPASPPTAPTTGWSRRRWASIAGVGLTLVLAAGGAWLAYRPLARSPRPVIQTKPDTTKGLTKVIAPPGPDTAIRDSGGDTTAAAVANGIAAVKNPTDSATAAPFAVQLMAANTQAGAILKLQQEGKNLPAATFAPVLIQSARWFRVIGGAFPTRAEADTLLAELRRRRVLDGGSGIVVRLPFAFLIDSGVPATAVAGMVATYADRGQPVYALRQPNGTAWLLAGAFESLEQSSLYAESLRASGIKPVLVYRKGRTF